MMKNFLPSLCGLAALLMVSACSSDDLLTEADGDGEATVTFNVNALGSASTRTYSDGTTATVLRYGVYDSSTGYLSAISSEKVGTATMEDLQATVTLNLAKGNSYTIVFWAEAANSPYEVSFADTGTDDDGNETDVSPTVTFKDSYDIVNNDENRDAFYAVVETGEVSSSYAATVTLTRPFAQLNVGTLSTDLAAYEATGNSVAYTKVVVTGVGNTLNLLTGEVTYDGSTSGGEVTFDWAAIPDADEESFPLNSSSSSDNDSSSDNSDSSSSDVSTSTDDATDITFDYLAMNYLLVGEDACTVDVEFYYSASSAEESGHVVEVSSVPVRRNYQTNLYGSLLTSQFTYNVQIDKTYAGTYGIEVENTSYVSAEYDLAVALAYGSDIVYVTSDMTLNSYRLSVYEDVVIDLQGYTLTLEQTGNYIYTKASDIDVIVTGGTINTAYRAVVVATDDSSVTLEDVEIVSTCTAGYTPIQVSGTNSSFTMTGGSITANTFSVYVTGEGATVTLEDTEITAGVGVYVLNSATIEISGSTINTSGGYNNTSSYYPALWLATSDVEATVDDCEFTSGNSGMCVIIGTTDGTGNDVTLSNSTFTSTGDDSNACIQLLGTSNEVEIDGCTISGASIGVTQNGAPGGCDLTIENSTISATDTGIYLSNYADYDYNTLTMTNSTVTATGDGTPIEVKRTNLTVDNCTLVAETTEPQSYFVYGSGSSGVGYGIVLAGYRTTTSYEGDVSLSNITYKLSSTSVKYGTDLSVINVNYFDAESDYIYTGKPDDNWTGDDVYFYHNDYNDYGSDGAVTSSE